MKLKIADKSELSNPNNPNDSTWLNNFYMASQPSTVTNNRVTSKGISLAGNGNNLTAGHIGGGTGYGSSSYVTHSTKAKQNSFIVKNAKSGNMRASGVVTAD